MTIDNLGWVGFLTNGLHVTDATVLLQSNGAQVLPCLLYRLAVFAFIEITVVHAPEQTVAEERCTRSFRPWCILFTEHRTTPISIGTLTTSHTFGKLLETLHKDVAMLIVVRHICQHLGQSCKYPTITSCPETLPSVASRLDLWPNVLAVAIAVGAAESHDPHTADLTDRVVDADTALRLAAVVVVVISDVALVGAAEVVVSAGTLLLQEVSKSAKDRKAAVRMVFLFMDIPLVV